MGRLGTALSVAVSLTAAAGATLAGLLAQPTTAAATTRAEPSPSALSRSAHVAYLNCPARDVLLTGSVQRQSFATGQPVSYTVSIHDLSHTACGYANGVTVPTNAINPAAGLLGPCGEVPVQVENSRGSVVYPAVGVGCPLILGPPLAAGQTITTTGTWDQIAWGITALQRGAGALVPRGEYRLLIDRKVTLPIDLTGPPFISPPATLPPRTNPLPAPSTPAQPLPNLPAPTIPSTSPPSTTTTTTAPTAPTTPTAPSTPSEHPVTRSAHVAFDGCSAKAITLTVTIPAGSTLPAPVHYDVAVHNGGNTACGKAFRNDPSLTRQFRVGVCSSMPATFVNAFGVNVYPGPQVYMCPMIAGPYISPHTTVTTTGTWPGTEFHAGSGIASPPSQTAPPGKYTLVVDSAVDVPFTLTAP